MEQARRIATIVAGVGGAALLVVTSTHWSRPGVSVSLFDVPERVRSHDPLAAVAIAVPVVAIVAGLAGLRRWPVALLAGGVAAVLQPLAFLVGTPYPAWVDAVSTGGRPLLVVGGLTAAQSLLRQGAGRWGAIVAGLTIGAPLVTSLLENPWWRRPATAAVPWYPAAIALGLAAMVPAVWLLRGGDPAARPDTGRRWEWSRLRLVLAGGLALAIVFSLSLLSVQLVSRLLGLREDTLFRHQIVADAVVGAIGIVVVLCLAAMTGPWSVGGVLTAAAVQVGMAAPMLLVAYGIQLTSPAVVAVVAGLVAGAVLAGGRRRFPVAAAVAGVVAVALYLFQAATGGDPVLPARQGFVPGLVIAVLVGAVVAAVVGACASALAPAGAVPAVLGPLAALVAAGGQQVMATTYGSRSAHFNLTTSAVLLLAAAAAVGGLGLAQQWAHRRAERRHAEQIRQEAAEAERNRLARPIHDGVLQVLALMQRHGGELGGAGPRLAALAGEQEIALRSLLSGGGDISPPPGRRAAQRDLRAGFSTLASAAVQVAAPAEPVLLADAAAAELTAAVRAALDNVRRHAGPGARAWVLVEDEDDAVRVTVRDDGVGFAPERLAEAADAGRLGVAQSMRGRIADLGGRTEIFSRPGRGTEVEFWVPRGQSAPQRPGQA
ncbi:sensor histidine kinase [Dactylosporangium sp. CA-092794]|uniref:sensor histidine kinase n=1 Tax=Dactylosporangium sp. CA-092794 TaxID=3239929 RepID=UPI003D8FC67D